MIWDGAAEDVRTKQMDKEKNELRVIHIIGPKQGEGRARKVLKALLALAGKGANSYRAR